MEINDWDKLYYQDGYISKREPAQLLRDNIGLLPKGKALDLAMGEGRNALYLAGQGYTVTGVDRSGAAVRKCLHLAKEWGVLVNAMTADLTFYSVPPEEYDLIINFYYLQRDLIPKIKSGLKPGGMVVFETYTEEQVRYGHPRNPAYLLKSNELLHSFLDYKVIIYRELVLNVKKPRPAPCGAGKEKAIASIIAQKP
jgi:2-polyprenyl-3-methyl-5-hydroxy-6-metoxy-1,4-benzoquinol methylase